MWYQNIRSASFSFVEIRASDGQTDRHKDRRTDRQNCESNTVRCITRRTVKTIIFTVHHFDAIFISQNAPNSIPSWWDGTHFPFSKNPLALGSPLMSCRSVDQNVSSKTCRPVVQKVSPTWLVAQMTVHCPHHPGPTRRAGRCIVCRRYADALPTPAACATVPFKASTTLVCFSCSSTLALQID